MGNYDSILKEKKKFEDEELIKEKKPKKFPWLLIDVVGLVLILVVSYVIYYNTILAPKEMFLNDLDSAIKEYGIIFETLDLDKFNNSTYNLLGTIEGSSKYDFSLDKLTDKIHFNLANEESSLDCWLASEKSYIELSSLGDYYLEVDIDKFKYFEVIANYNEKWALDIDEDKFIKKFYFDGTSPIVESNLVLEGEELQKILRLDNMDKNYEVLFTFKNNAITNEIINMKVTINNLDDDKRMVVLYEDGFLIYKDDDNNVKFYLEKNNKDFTLKIYKNDILFSVLTGNNQDKSYLYSYQVIDKIYNVKVKLSKMGDEYNYLVTSLIEEDDVRKERELDIKFKYSLAEHIADHIISSDLNYNNLIEEKKMEFDEGLDKMLSGLREFVIKN